MYLLTANDCYINLCFSSSNFFDSDLLYLLLHNSNAYFSALLLLKLCFFSNTRDPKPRTQK